VGLEEGHVHVRRLARSCHIVLTLAGSCTSMRGLSIVVTACPQLSSRFVLTKTYDF
jgi:hypothetical protein